MIPAAGAPAVPDRDALVALDADAFSALSDHEVLALVLGSSPAFASRVLSVIGGWIPLVRADVAELAAIQGCDVPAAVRVVASLELGRRSMRALAAPRTQIVGPEDAVALLHPRLAHLDRERSVVLILDRKHRILREATIGLGGVAHAPLAPREVLGAVLRCPGAAAVLVAHNHPSGDPEPSAEDRAVTRRLTEAAAIVGVELLDHVIVAASGWVSLRRQDG